MHYRVTARLIEETAAEFFRKLSDGSIADQKPDGREIIASMQRARIDPSGDICWSERCYCATPLEHERQTVYDQYFREMTTVEIAQDAEPRFEGQPLMEYLEQL